MANSKKRLFLISVAVQVLSLILMALPFSYAMTFAAGPDYFPVSTTSYFNYLIIGYGMWAPLFTTVFTVLWLIASAVHGIVCAANGKQGKGNRTPGFLLILGGLDLLCALLCVFFSNPILIVTVLIALLLLGALMLQILYCKRMADT